jgi:YD repeat-containing protein
MFVKGSAEYGYDSSQANLDVQLNPTSGLIYVNNYYVDTTATPCKPGNVAGWPCRSVDPDGNITRTIYDPLGRQTST